VKEQKQVSVEQEAIDLIEDIDPIEHLSKRKKVDS